MKNHALHLLAAAGWFALGGAASAATTVNFGSVSTVTGPGSLDLTGNIVYAVNFRGVDETVNGVLFRSDTAPIAGATFLGPQNVGAWQTKPEFGATASDTALENIYHDIRWANAADANVAARVLGADLNVTQGAPYKLQILFYGNHDEDRRWDITVDGVQAVDQITSLGVSNGGPAVPPPGTAYSLNQGLVYTYNFTAPDTQVNILMGQIFGVQEGGDLNPIWQGLTLERIPEPSALALGGLGVLALLRRRRRS